MKKAVKSATPADTASVRDMSVYTRTGDKGKTRLYQGKTVSKSSLKIDSIGSIDELNSVLGLSISKLKGYSSVKNELISIQNDLFEIGGSLAGSSLKTDLNERVKNFEKIIDGLTKKLPELNNFILPGGSLTGSLLHLVRSIARKAERRVVELSQKEEIESSILIYLNRLSDLLFMFARFVNYKEKKKENIWKSR